MDPLSSTLPLPMLRLGLPENADASLRVLAIGAHSDDIEIGCGGTLMRLARAYHHLHLDWVVLSATGARIEEARQSAASFTAGVGSVNVVVRDFRVSYFPYVGDALKDYFEELKGTAPDLVLTHQRHDLHQDHRVVCELTWNTFREHLIWEYEIPKYDGDLGSPGLFVHLDRATSRRKIDLLLAHFQTQANKHWFTGETFEALMRLRGMESRAPEGCAEAFYVRKTVVGMPPDGGAGP